MKYNGNDVDERLMFLNEFKKHFLDMSVQLMTSYAGLYIERINGKTPECGEFFIKLRPDQYDDRAEWLIEKVKVVVFEYLLTGEAKV